MFYDILRRLICSTSFNQHSSSLGLEFCCAFSWSASLFPLRNVNHGSAHQRPQMDNVLLLFYDSASVYSARLTSTTHAPGFRIHQKATVKPSKQKAINHGHAKENKRVTKTPHLSARFTARQVRSLRDPAAKKTVHIPNESPLIKNIENVVNPTKNPIPRVR